MKKYTLIPKGAPDGLTDLIDDVETNGKLVLPMVDGEYTLIVEGISTEDARLFRKAKANLVEAEAPAVEVGAQEPQETLPPELLPAGDVPAAEAGTEKPEAEAQPQA